MKKHIECIWRSSPSPLVPFKPEIGKGGNNIRPLRKVESQVAAEELSSNGAPCLPIRGLARKLLHCITLPSHGRLPFSLGCWSRKVQLRRSNATVMQLEVAFSLPGTGQKEHQELKNRKNAQPLAPPSPSESVSWPRSKSNMMGYTVKRLIMVYAYALPRPSTPCPASLRPKCTPPLPKRLPWATGLQSPRLWPGKHLPLLLLRRMWLILRGNLIAQPRCSWEDDGCESEDDEGNSQEPEANNDDIPDMDNAVANKNQPKPGKLHLSASARRSRLRRR